MKTFVVQTYLNGVMVVLLRLTTSPHYDTPRTATEHDNVHYHTTTLSQLLLGSPVCTQVHACNCAQFLPFPHP
jgi:hypothetical protein